MFKIAVLPGDGVGPEVVRQGLKVLSAVAKRYGHDFQFREALLGGCSIDEAGTPLTAESLNLAKESHAVLLGAVGGPKWEEVEYEIRPEKALLDLREKLGLFANLRPAKIFSPLVSASPLKREWVEGVDLIVLRELTGGIYFGNPRGIYLEGESRVGINTEVYADWEVERIVRKAFEVARLRRKKVTSVDKANVLESGKLWRDVANRIKAEYADCQLNHMLVDNCAMQLIRDPRQFDVIVTSNMFGDILSDEAAMLTGSIGMLPSASLGGATGLYEPVHGSAPDIAGKDLANPLGTILSVAMMLNYSFGLKREAEKVEASALKILEQGFRTRDIYQEGTKLTGTEEMGDLIAAEVSL